MAKPVLIAMSASLPLGQNQSKIALHIANLLECEQNAQVLYANCCQHNTGFKQLAHLLGERPCGYSLEEFRHLRRHKPSRLPHGTVLSSLRRGSVRPASPIIATALFENGG